jgi:hypothetical protein
MAVDLTLHLGKDQRTQRDAWPDESVRIARSTTLPLPCACTRPATAPDVFGGERT